MVTASGSLNHRSAQLVSHVTTSEVVTPMSSRVLVCVYRTKVDGGGGAPLLPVPSSSSASAAEPPAEPPADPPSELEVPHVISIGSIDDRTGNGAWGIEDRGTGV